MRHLPLIAVVVGLSFALTTEMGCRDWDRFAAVSGDGGTTGGDITSGGGVSDGGGGAGTGASGGTGGTGGGTVKCSSVVLLAENYEGSFDYANFYWGSSNGTATADYESGELVLSADMATSDDVYLGTRFAHDATDAAISIEVTQHPAPGSHGFWFEYGQGGDWAELYMNGSELEANSYDNASDTSTNHATVPQDAMAQRFLQLREANGTFYWEVSPDGSNWTEIASTSTAALFDLEYAHVHIGYWSDDGGSVAFDNFNGGAAAMGGECSADTLIDDYSGAFDHVWGSGFDDTGCSVYADVRVHLGYEVGASGDCGRGSSRLYDLRGSVLELELSNTPQSGENAIVYVTAVDRAGRGAGWALTEGQLAYAEVDGFSLSVTTVSSFSSLWLRLREDAGRIYIDSSDDGATWTPRYDAMAIAGFDATAVQLMVGEELTVPTPIYLDYHADNFNLPP